MTTTKRGKLDLEPEAVPDLWRWGDAGLLADNGDIGNPLGDCKVNQNWTVLEKQAEVSCTGRQGSCRFPEIHHSGVFVYTQVVIWFCSESI